MRPDILGNVISLMMLSQTAKSATSLNDLVEKPAPSSLATLIEMMSPVNAIPSLRAIKEYLLTLPTTYPTATLPEHTYTTVQLGILGGLKSAVSSLSPGSFNVLGFPIVSIFASAMTHGDELADLIAEVTAMITAEINRVNPAVALVEFALLNSPPSGTVLAAGTTEANFDLQLASQFAAGDTISVALNGDSFIAPITITADDISAAEVVLSLSLVSVPTDTDLVFSFTVVPAVDSAPVSVTAPAFQLGA